MFRTFVTSLFDSVLNLIGTHPVVCIVVVTVLVGLRVMKAWSKFEKSSRIR